MFNTDKALKAQSDYCAKHGYINFAPRYDGTCFHCGRNIYQSFRHSSGVITGITVERAGKTIITSCPHCNYSFVE